mmetsp:Transcript_36129/g.86557  ORF Transcript_36129/g.86557 Transcript_36129/m.86557 type:complete len:208 (-) Transcript_36129:1278-1901(-)
MPWRPRKRSSSTWRNPSRSRPELRSRRLKGPRRSAGERRGSTSWMPSRRRIVRRTPIPSPAQARRRSPRPRAKSRGCTLPPPIWFLAARWLSRSTWSFDMGRTRSAKMALAAFFLRKMSRVSTPRRGQELVQSAPAPSRSSALWRAAAAARCTVTRRATKSLKIVCLDLQLFRKRVPWRGPHGPQSSHPTRPGAPSWALHPHQARDD